MSSNAHSDLVQQMVASIRRHAVVIDIKRQALAAAAKDFSDNTILSNGQHVTYLPASHATAGTIIKRRPRPLFVVTAATSRMLLLEGVPFRVGNGMKR
jgi:hypothetical protein